jgi:hypothetical protein
MRRGNSAAFSNEMDDKVSCVEYKLCSCVCQLSLKKSHPVRVTKYGIV